MVMLTSPLVAQAADGRQEKQLTNEVVPRRALNTNESSVLAQCVETLKQLRTNKTSEATSQRRMAIVRLKKLRHVEALPALQTVAQDEAEDYQLRVRAIDAIARTRDKEAVEFLVALISSPNGQVYRATIEGLENVTGVSQGSRAFSSDPEYIAVKRAEMQQKWQAWWKANITTYKPREDLDWFYRE